MGYASWGNYFRFTLLPADHSRMSEAEAVTQTRSALGGDAHAPTDVAAIYRLYDDGGRATTLILPADFPGPPAPPGDRESLAPKDLHMWVQRHIAWRREADERGTVLSHRCRLVWLVEQTCVGDTIRAPRGEVRLTVVDAEIGRILTTYGRPRTELEQ